MFLRKLEIRQFRTHSESKFQFTAGINLIHGPNGVGKTNVLEAIHYLCLGRSFVASKDSYALQFGQQFFEIRGEFESKHRPAFQSRLVYQQDEGKRAFINGAPLERLSDLVGKVPVVILAPGDIALTDGPPDERRRFLDNTLSQAKPSYLSELLKYRRTMKQRNTILGRGQRVDPSLLRPWDAEFSKSAARITLARFEFVRRFNGYLDEAYGMMDAIAETPSIEYRPFAEIPEGAGADSILALHEERLRSAFPREREQRRSLVGPHRDELVFVLDGVEVRRYASQGQHRTFGMALQLAKFLYLRAIHEETPLLLLDDVFGDLDRHRSAVFLNLLSSRDAIGQSLITSADERVFVESVTFGNGTHSKHEMNDKQPTEVKS